MLSILNFDSHKIPLEDWIEIGVTWLVKNFRPQFQAIKWPVEQTLNGIDQLLQLLPPILVLIVLFIIAWRIAGWRIGLFSVITFTFIGFLGFWQDTMTTLAMVLSAVFFCTVAGIHHSGLRLSGPRSHAVQHWNSGGSNCHNHIFHASHYSPYKFGYSTSAA